MTHVTAILAIGSNLGDRLAHLQAAVDFLAAAKHVEVLRVSPVLETEPVGGPDQGRFLNAVVEVETSLTSLALLAVCQAAECAGDRVREVRWGPRTIDVDIVVFGDERSASAELTLPHPRAAERGFVLQPWALMDPEAQLVVEAGESAQSVAELACAAADYAGLRQYDGSLVVH